MSSKLSALTALTGANLASDDEFYVGDVSVTTSKKMTAAQLLSGLISTVKIANHILFAANNTYDIGDNAATGKPRNIIAGGDVVAGAGMQVSTNGVLSWAARLSSSAPADGVFQLRDAAATGFGRIILGPNSTSFPSLKRDGIGVAVRLGDDSAGSFIKVGSYTVAGVPSASTSGAGAIIYVSNEAGGATLAFSDGTNWKRVSDLATIS